MVFQVLFTRESCSRIRLANGINVKVTIYSIALAKIFL